MGIFDKLKEMFSGAKKSVSDKVPEGIADKAGDLRQTVGGAVEGVIDKTADLADSATGHKFSEQIDKVKGMADKIDGHPENAPDGMGEGEA